LCGLLHVLRALALGRRQSSRSSATIAHHGSDGGTLAARGELAACAHPLFEVVPGAIEPWEKTKDF